MTLSIQTSARGVQRAERRFVESAARISATDLTDRPQAPDTVQITGEARPRLYGQRAPYVSTLADEAVQMKQAERAYRANLGALKVELRVEDAALELVSDEPDADEERGEQAEG